MTASTAIATRPYGIMPGGCFPLPAATGPDNPSGCWDDRPLRPAPLPIDRNCWIPRNADGNPIQLPAPDATIQATEGAALLA